MSCGPCYLYKFLSVICPRGERSFLDAFNLKEMSLTFGEAERKVKMTLNTTKTDDQNSGDE